MKKIFIVLLGMFLFVGCASQRQKPVCAEIEYRLNHTSMSPDQREWTREELEQCRAEQEEYAKSDSLTNRLKKSIYEQFADSKKDSAKVDSAKVPAEGSAPVSGKSAEPESAENGEAPSSENEDGESQNFKNENGENGNVENAGAVEKIEDAEEKAP